MKRLTQKQVLMMHKQLVEQTGGSDKVLDYALLDSALENPFQTFDGKDVVAEDGEVGAVVPCVAECDGAATVAVAVLLRVDNCGDREAGTVQRRG